MSRQIKLNLECGLIYCEACQYKDSIGYCKMFNVFLQMGSESKEFIRCKLCKDAEEEA